MKHYDREKKKWVGDDEINRKLARRKLCKGGRDHDWALMLPYLVEHKDSRLGLEVAEEYYRLAEEMWEKRKQFQEEEKAQLDRLGIKARSWGWDPAPTRQYICLTCQKQHYGELKGK